MDPKTKTGLLEYLEMRVKGKVFKYQGQIDKRRKLNKEDRCLFATIHISAFNEILEEIDNCYDNLKIKRTFQVDENAETLEDKLRDEHRPIPEEREDAIKFHTFKEMIEDDRPTPKGEKEDHSKLFEIFAEKFKPNWNPPKDNKIKW